MSPPLSSFQAEVHLLGNRHVLFGPGVVEHNLLSVIDDLRCTSVLVVASKSLMKQTAVSSLLSEVLGTRLGAVFTNTPQHSPLSSVRAGIATAAEIRADVLLAVGGGSAIDMAKGINIFAHEGFRPVELRPRLVGTRTKPPAYSGSRFPLVVIPTTLSGAEVTPVVGLTDDVTRLKSQYLDPGGAATAVLYDPEIVRYTPDRLWISTGIKAFDSAMERVWSLDHQPFTDAIALQSLAMLKRHLLASRDPDNLGSRSQVQYAVWLAMIGAGSVRAALSAAMRHILGGKYDLPHGVCCGIILPHVMGFNAAAVPERLESIGHALGIDGMTAMETGEKAIDFMASLIRQVGLPTRLRDVGVQESDLPELARMTTTDYFAFTNPRPVTSLDDMLSLWQAMY